MSIHEAALILYGDRSGTTKPQTTTCACGEVIPNNRGGRCYACGQQEIRENNAMCERESRQIEQDWSE